MGIRIVCVGRAEPKRGSDNAAKSDSGGPVVEPDPGSNVELAGTVFSGESGGARFYFSKIRFLYWELDSGAT